MYAANVGTNRNDRDAGSVHGAGHTKKGNTGKFCAFIWNFRHFFTYAVSYAVNRKPFAGYAGGHRIASVRSCVGGKNRYRDGVLLTVTGIYLGPERNLTLFFGALVLCGIWALGLLALRKKRRTDCIPFVPFLLAAYMGMLAGA